MKWYNRVHVAYFLSHPEGPAGKEYSIDLRNLVDCFACVWPRNHHDGGGNRMDFPWKREARGGCAAGLAYGSHLDR